MLPIREAAKMLGVSIQHMHGIPEDLLPAVRTKGGHRRYKEKDILAYMGESVEDGLRQNIAVIYSRVSSQDQKQKGDLDRQKLRNYDYCKKHGYIVHDTIEECASGMKDGRSKLAKLIRMAEDKEYNILVIEHRDRLTRFSFKTFEAFFMALGVTVVCAEEILPKSFENELVEDIMMLMNSFSAKIYGKRAHRNKLKKDGATY